MAADSDSGRSTGYLLNSSAHKGTLTRFVGEARLVGCELEQLTLIGHRYRRIRRQHAVGRCWL